LKPQGLSSKERIKSKKDFSELYSNGKILISGDQKIKAVYLIDKKSGNGIKIAAVVSKKSGKAYWRNRIKRLIKDSYRLNKEELITAVSKKKRNIRIVFSSYNLNDRKNKKIGLNDIMLPVAELMRRIKTEL